MLFNILEFDNIDFDSLNSQIEDLVNKILKDKLLDSIKQIDGSGSGIDADLLDGLDSSAFAKNDLSNVDNTIVLDKVKQVDGANSGLDADKLDGLDSSAFALADLSNVSNEALLAKLGEIGITEDCCNGSGGSGGGGSGGGTNEPINADTLENLDSSQFLRRDRSDYPTQDEHFNLGNPTHKWNNIYALTFQGDTLQANNADLAEKYTCKDELEIGDVVCITEDSYFETEKCNDIASHKVVGVYSENPALIMNKNKRDGYTIAIRGKVPIKVIGKVNKGDPLVSYKDGYAVSVFNKELLKDLKIEKQMIIGKALENSDKQNNLIKAIII